MLCQQLGYPATREQVERRLNQIRADERHSVYVASRADGEILGWIHVALRKLIMDDRYAEIEGLVVDESQRRRGAGRLLMEQAERWARTNGCVAVNLRSNVVRREAHDFYERIGYTHIKTQKTFRKILSALK